MTTVYIIATIISVLGAVDMTLANVLATNKQSAIYKEAESILNELTAKRARAAELYRAATNKQDNILREMINSHPVSSRTRSIMRQYINQARIVEGKAKDMDISDSNIQHATNRTQTELAKSQSSGSFVGDMLNAGIKKVKEYMKPRQPGSDKYVREVRM